MDSSNTPSNFTGLQVKRRLAMEEKGEVPFLYKQYLDKRLNPRWTSSFFMEQLMAYIYHLENDVEGLQRSLAISLKEARDWLYESHGVELPDIDDDDGWLGEARRLLENNK